MASTANQEADNQIERPGDQAPTTPSTNIDHVRYPAPAYRRTLTCHRVAPVCLRIMHETNLSLVLLTPEQRSLPNVQRTVMVPIDAGSAGTLYSLALLQRALPVETGHPGLGHGRKKNPRRHHARHHFAKGLPFELLNDHRI
jgi:hypothetical protein